MPAGSNPKASIHDELSHLSPAESFGRGVRTSLTNNASAYGYSVTITCAFGLVAARHKPEDYTVPILAFATGAGLAFLMMELATARAFSRLHHGRGDRELLLRGAFDLIAVLAAVSTAAAAARTPGLVAWVLTALASTVVFLLAGGLDVVMAHRAARRRDHRPSGG